MVSMKKTMMAVIVACGLMGGAYVATAGCGSCGAAAKSEKKHDHDHCEKAEKMACVKCAHTKACTAEDCADAAHDAACTCVKKEKADKKCEG